MQQKIIWMLFLIFGISIIVNLGGCSNDYSLTVEWVYINETDSLISFEPNEPEFNLPPKDTVIFRDITEGEKDTDITKQNALHRPMIVFYGTNKCDTLLGRSGLELGPSSIENYEIEKKGENNFKCTFRFTVQTLQRAKSCK